MTPRRTAWLGLAAALLTLGATAAPAAAATTGTASIGEVVLYADCAAQPVTYALQLDPGTTDWDLGLEVFAADGSDAGQGVHLTSAASTSSGTVDLHLCATLLPGSYTLRGTGHATTSGTSQPFTLAPVGFAVRDAASRVTLKAHPLGNGNTRVAVRVEEEAASGYQPIEGKVRVYFRYAERGGGSHNLHGSRRIVHHGRATLLMQGPRHPPLVIWAHIFSGANVAGSRSNSVTIH